MSVGFWEVGNEGCGWDCEGAGAGAGASARRIISSPRKSDGSSISGSLSDTSSIRGLDMLVAVAPQLLRDMVGSRKVVEVYALQSMCLHSSSGTVLRWYIIWQPTANRCASVGVSWKNFGARVCTARRTPSVTSGFKSVRYCGYKWSIMPDPTTLA